MVMPNALALSTDGEACPKEEHPLEKQLITDNGYTLF
jgi:hypothetical protein